MLSIIIPAYNEERRLGRTLKETKRYLVAKGIVHELIVVDDGSKDGTLAVAKKVPGVKVLGNKHNKGKGYAVRTGMLAARGTHVLFMDADPATSLEAIPRALKAAAKSEVVIGSRKVRGARIERRQPFLRRVVGGVFPLFLGLLGMKRYEDTQCGFKLFTREAAQKVFSQSVIDGFSFDVEALYLAQRAGYKVKELPVRWRNDPDSRVQAFSDGARMLFEVVGMRGAHSKHEGVRRLARRLLSSSRAASVFLSYVLFSGIATLVDFSVLVSLTELGGVHYLTSAAVGYVTGMLVHYALNKRHTFKNKSRRYALQLGVHALVATTGLALHQSLLFLLVERAGWWYVWGKVASTLVTLCWNYAGHSRLTFGRIK